MFQAVGFTALSVCMYLQGDLWGMWCSGAFAVLAAWSLAIVFTRKPDSLKGIAEEYGFEVEPRSPDEVVLKRVRKGRPWWA